MLHRYFMIVALLCGLWGALLPTGCGTAPEKNLADTSPSTTESSTLDILQETIYPTSFDIDVNFTRLLHTVWHLDDATVNAFRIGIKISDCNLLSQIRIIGQPQNQGPASTVDLTSIGSWDDASGCFTPDLIARVTSPTAEIVPWKMQILDPNNNVLDTFVTDPVRSGPHQHSHGPKPLK